MVVSSVPKSRRQDQLILRNDSSNSTVPVDDLLTRKSADPTSSASQSTSTTVAASSKSVRFNECQNQYFANGVRCAEDCPESWYEKVDYALFKVEARDTILDLMEDETLVHLLEELYRVCCQVDFVLEDASDLLNNHKDNARLLKKLSKVYSSASRDLDLHLHGLEYHIACAVKECCQERNEKIQDIVQDIQMEQEHGLWAAGEMEEEMRDSCMIFSQPSSLFAQLLALAMAGKKRKQQVTEQSSSA